MVALPGPLKLSVLKELLQSAYFHIFLNNNGLSFYGARIATFVVGTYVIIIVVITFTCLKTIKSNDTRKTVEN